ncbi:thiosulfate:glutathione sulfurtransferase isoform X1 [Lepisosteus oculatus]|uniref:thiosulfate:glutathione sulfurtransferase isoform X1 n=1 Tax=Lepisosteus oculatus TaxID=7918 RepID=UPI00371B3408
MRLGLLVLNAVALLALRRAVAAGAEALGGGGGPSVCGSNKPYSLGGVRASAAELPESLPGDKVVSYDELKDMLGRHAVQLFDVRNPDEFASGRIPGSTNIPLGKLEEALKLSPETFRQLYKVDSPKKDDADIVFHCQSGRRSAIALHTAMGLGYTQARHYAGGYSEWSQRQRK